MASSGARTPGVRGVSWRERETLDLISLWGQAGVQRALSTFHRNIDLFEKIAREMQLRGHNRSAIECRTKSKLLRKEYRKSLSHNSISGNAPKYCLFYPQLDRIFRGDPSIQQPQSLACSLPFRVTREEDGVESAEGSQEPFSPDPETFMHPPLLASSPAIPEQQANSGGSLEGSPQCRAQEVDLPTEDQTTITLKVVPTAPEEGSPVGRLEQTGTGEQVGSAERNNPSTSQNEGQRATRQNTQPTPAERIASARNRKRRVAALTDVARELVRQGERDHELSAIQHAEVMQFERQRYQSEVERSQAFQDRFFADAAADRDLHRELMLTNLEVMRSAVDAIRNIGAALAREGGDGHPMHAGVSASTSNAARQDTKPLQENRVPAVARVPSAGLGVAASRGDDQELSRGKRACAGKGRKRMDL